MNPGARRIFAASAGALALAFGAAPAFAWDIHQLLMPGVLSGLPSRAKTALAQPFSGPCTLRSSEEYSKLKAALELNPANELAMPESLCQDGENAEKLLLAATLDEPDQGMDKDLPDSYDPSDERQWMGGKTGGSSQGFRHMYFGGWKLGAPITTFQFPLHAIGEAPVRARILADKGRELLRAGNAAWGWRVLGWAMHYIQDLAQPFHAVQVVDVRMMPLGNLFAWPPSEGFHRLVEETTRTISNYHWALEGYVRESLRGPDSPFRQCLENPESHMTVVAGPDDPPLDPEDIALANAAASVKLAPDIGREEIEVIGTGLMDPGIYLSRNQGSVDFGDLLHRPGTPEFAGDRARLNESLCSALANASWGSRALIRWALGAR